MTLRPVDSEPTGIPFPPHQSKIVKEGVGGGEEEIVKDGGRDINSLVEDVEGKNTQTNSKVYFSIRYFWKNPSLRSLICNNILEYVLENILM